MSRCFISRRDLRAHAAAFTRGVSSPSLGPTQNSWSAGAVRPGANRAAPTSPRTGSLDDAWADSWGFAARSAAHRRELLAARWRLLAKGIQEPIRGPRRLSGLSRASG